jgi:aquaporin rerated protein, other eukaryote
MSSHLSNLRNDLLTALLEFFGTTLFLFIGFGGIQASAAEAARNPATASHIDQVLYISTCMGLSLLVSAWMFYRVSGAVFNPNISLALFLVGALKPVRFALYSTAQLAGGVAASWLIYALTPGDIVFKSVVVIHPIANH